MNLKITLLNIRYILARREHKLPIELGIEEEEEVFTAKNGKASYAPTNPICNCHPD